MVWVFVIILLAQPMHPGKQRHFDILIGIANLKLFYLNFNLSLNFCIKFRMMTKKKSGLIINISSYGGLRYLFNVAYGIGKAGKDRMAADCAHELKKYNVAMISLWPGAVKTEKMKENVLGKYY